MHGLCEDEHLVPYIPTPIVLLLTIKYCSVRPVYNSMTVGDNTGILQYHRNELFEPKKEYFVL